MRHSWVNYLRWLLGTQARLRLASRARQGASDGGAMHRGLLLEGPLELDADAAARGVSERLLGPVGENVGLETVNEEQSGCSEK